MESACLSRAKHARSDSRPRQAGAFSSAWLPRVKAQAWLAHSKARTPKWSRTIAMGARFCHGRHAHAEAPRPTMRAHTHTERSRTRTQRSGTRTRKSESAPLMVERDRLGVRPLRNFMPLCLHPSSLILHQWDLTSGICVQIAG